jgi:hypothetical protein
MAPDHSLTTKGAPHLITLTPAAFMGPSTMDGRATDHSLIVS